TRWRSTTSMPASTGSPAARRSARWCCSTERRGGRAAAHCAPRSMDSALQPQRRAQRLAVATAGREPGAVAQAQAVLPGTERLDLLDQVDAYRARAVHAHEARRVQAIEQRGQRLAQQQAATREHQFDVVAL